MTAVSKFHFIAVIAFAQLLNAQGTPATDSAPVPPAIAAARKVFISNAGADDESGKIFGAGTDRCYSEFYHQVQALNRYEIVSNPTDADIVFEINLTLSKRDYHNSANVSDSVVRVRILDPRTRTILWAFYDRPDFAGLKSNYLKNLGKAIKQIVSNLQALTVANSANP